MFPEVSLRFPRTGEFVTEVIVQVPEVSGMITLLKWIWREFSTENAIELTLGLLIFFLMIVGILVVLFLQYREVLKLKLYLWAVAVLNAVESFDRIVNDEIGKLPRAYTFYDEELWEQSKTRNEKKREARAAKKRAKKLKKLQAQMKAAQRADPMYGYRDLAEFIQDCSADGGWWADDRAINNGEPDEDDDDGWLEDNVDWQENNTFRAEGHDDGLKNDNCSLHDKAGRSEYDSYRRENNNADL